MVFESKSVQCPLSYRSISREGKDDFFVRILRNTSLVLSQTTQTDRDWDHRYLDLIRISIAEGCDTQALSNKGS